jgi:hypothetical protein
LKKVSTASGTIIGESIRLGSALDGIPLTVWRIRSGGSERLSPQQEAAGMPSRWTLIEFEIRCSGPPLVGAPHALALRLAAQVRRVLTFTKPR